MTLLLPDDGSPAAADLVVEYRAKRIEPHWQEPGEPLSQPGVVRDGAGIAPSGAP